MEGEGGGGVEGVGGGVERRVLRVWKVVMRRVGGEDRWELEMGKEEGGEWMVMGGKREEEMGWVER